MLMPTHGTRTTPAQRAAAVKEMAEHEGFDACGIAAANGPDSEDRLGEWLSLDYHADMAWMAASKEVRQDVQKKLPGARSVVVVARSYYAERPTKPPNSGRVSRYAWGRDYHRVLKKPLRRLARSIETLGEDVQTYCSIDSGPVLEKMWAARAGVGWIGKNSLVLRRGLGSWFFLATVLTTLDIEPDEPLADGCGNCRLCLVACPTDAIVAPQWVDARKCISYQTIENRGEVPMAIAEHHGDWLFGCDICQEVCPWNRKVAPTDEPDFRPRPGHAHIDLGTLEHMNEEEFRAKFQGTPLMRAKYHGMQRNAAIVRRNTRG